MLLLLQSGEQRCPMCHTRFGSSARPVTHDEKRANTATHAPTPVQTAVAEDAPPAQHAATRVEVDNKPPRHRRRRGAPKTDARSAAPICESLFEAAALVEPQPKARTPFAPPPKPVIVDIPEAAIREERTSVDAPEVRFPSTGVKPRPVPEPRAPAAVVVPPPVAPPIARVVTPPATPIAR